MGLKRSNQHFWPRPNHRIRTLVFLSLCLFLPTSLFLNRSESSRLQEDGGRNHTRVLLPNQRHQRRATRSHWTCWRRFDHEGRWRWGKRVCVCVGGRVATLVLWAQSSEAGQRGDVASFMALFLRLQLRRYQLNATPRWRR